MKPYQGVLAVIIYLLSQLLIYCYISEDYYTIITGLIALIVFAFLLHKKKMLHISSKDLMMPRVLFCLGIGFGLSLISKVAILIGICSGQPIPEASVPNLFLWIITSVVLLPVVEELLFRGILFTSLSNSIPYKKAILFSAIIFMLLHGIVSWPSAFLSGVLLAWIYWSTNTLATAMIIHCAINLGSLLSIPLYMLLTADKLWGTIICLLVVLIGIVITYISTKLLLTKDDVLPS